MEKPIEFIITDKGRSTLRVSPEAIQILKKVNKPLKVVSVAGNYRTGKSFLLNRLMNRNDGFPLGSTVKSKTKGIWMWIGDHPNDPSKALLLLDTEGLNDVEKADRSHDAQIFTLAILLSSILVYNSVGAMGAEALEGLHVASELSKHIQTKQESSLEFATFFPAFIWAVRDFHLILEDDEGNDLTENQYLEMSLDVKPGITGSRDFTAIKQAIRDHFPKRDCFTFLPPASFKKMGRLETLKESELDEDFLETGQKFADFIIQSKAFFQLKGEVLRGQSFAILAEHYTKLINEGSINLQSAHDYMIMSMNSGAIATAMKKFKTFLDNLNMPLSPDNFFKAYAEQREILFSEFRAECVNLGDHPKFKEEFDNQFLSLAKEYQTENCKVSEAICQEKLDEYYEAIDTKLKATQYHKPGGYHDLMKDLGCMEEKYRALGEQREMGPKYSDVRMEFWDKKVHVNILVMFG